MEEMVQCCDCEGFFPQNKVSPNYWGELFCERCWEVIRERTSRETKEYYEMLRQAWNEYD